MISGHALPAVRNLYIIGAGKAAAAMAAVTEALLGDRISAGVVVTKYGHSLPVERLKILEAAHPAPDKKSVQAVSRTLELLREATGEDVVLCLISGGASALWCDTPPGITLAEVQATFDQLVRCGASISEVNTVRKHLSGIKGGQLIRYCGGARVFSLVISDVPGDALDVIASGPTVADPSTFEDAWSVLVQYELTGLLPSPVVEHIHKGCRGVVPETPKPGDPIFRNCVSRVIGSNRVAVLAAEREARALGYFTQVVPGLVTGDAEAEARKLVAYAAGYKGEEPLCIIQGGETTVKVTGGGKGGRNQHFALAALKALQNEEEPISRNITILSGGTDGTDGPTDAAGGVADRHTQQVAAEKHLHPDRYLENHDAYHFLQQTGSLLMTGPTQTNVMDLMIALVN